MGQADVSAGALRINNVDKPNHDALLRVGIRTGIDTRFSLKGSIQEREMLVAELSATGRGEGDVCGVMGTLEFFLTRVMYKENVSDWFSLVAISVGAPCRNFGSPQMFLPGKRLADHSCFGPSLLDEYNRSAIGITVRKSNVVAFLEEESNL